MYVVDHDNNDEDRDQFPGWTYWNSESDQEAIENYVKNDQNGVTQLYRAGKQLLAGGTLLQ